MGSVATLAKRAQFKLSVGNNAVCLDALREVQCYSAFPPCRPCSDMGPCYKACGSINGCAAALGRTNAEYDCFRLCDCALGCAPQSARCIETAQTFQQAWSKDFDKVQPTSIVWWPACTMVAVVSTASILLYFIVVYPRPRPAFWIGERAPKLSERSASISALYSPIPTEELRA